MTDPIISDEIVEKFIAELYGEDWRGTAEKANIISLEEVRDALAAIYHDLVRVENEACAKVAKNIYGETQRFYASENAEIYYAQDMTCDKISDAILARHATKED